MKIYTLIHDENGNETEIELNDIAIFAQNDEIQMLIDYLNYVKEDNTVQETQNHLPITHNHLSMWKDGEYGKNNPDIQIWTAFDERKWRWR